MNQRERPRAYIARVFHWAEHKLGYDHLGNAFGRYLAVLAAFTVASTLSGSYFSVFLLRATGSDLALTRYNLLLACVQPFVMLLAVLVLRKGSVKVCLRVGLILHAAAYCVLAAAGEPDEKLIYALSALFASGNAFYYTSYTPLLLAYTQDENRDTAYGAMNLLTTCISLMLPLLTGFFLSALGSMTGYRALFALSAASLTLGLAFSTRLTPIEASNRDRVTRFRQTAARMFQNKSMRQAMIITFLNSVRVSGTACYGSLLMFALLKQESVMGVLTTACAVLGLLINMVYGRVMTPKRRGKSMLMGVLVTLVGAVILSAFQTAEGYAVYMLLSALVNVFLDTPVVTAYMGVLQHDEALRDKGAEVHALREFVYASGRAFGLLPAFFLPNIGAVSALMLAAIAVLQLPAALLALRLQKRLNA